MENMKYETKFSRQIISVLIFSNMAGAGDHSRSLKEALVESLNAILSPIHNVRISGEEQVKALEVTEGNYYVTDTTLIDVSCHTCFFSFEKKQQNINVIFIQRFIILRFGLLKFILCIQLFDTMYN